MTAGSLSVTFGTPERVDFHLSNWSRWLRTGQAVQGHAHSSSVVCGGATSKGFDEMAESSDRRCAVIVDTILQNLPAPQRIAIYTERGIVAAVFRFERTTYAEALAFGKLALGRELSRRGVW